MLSLFFIVLGIASLNPPVPQADRDSAAWDYVFGLFFLVVGAIGLVVGGVVTWLGRR